MTATTVTPTSGTSDFRDGTIRVLEDGERFVRCRTAPRSTYRSC